jgi:hypothetical protein
LACEIIKHIPGSEVPANVLLKVEGLPDEVDVMKLKAFFAEYQPVSFVEHKRGSKTAVVRFESDALAVSSNSNISCSTSISYVVGVGPG